MPGTWIGACWFDEIHYHIVPGPCPFKPRGGVSSITSVTGWRQRLGVATPPE